ncbi:hypothetical protein WJX84_001925, partial [Apatococcus fuscideae]
ALLGELLEGEKPFAEALAAMRAAAVAAESAEALTGDLRERRDSSKSKKSQKGAAISSSGSLSEGPSNQPLLWGNANFQAALAKRASSKGDPTLLRDLAHMSSGQLSQLPLSSPDGLLGARSS